MLTYAFNILFSTHQRDEPPLGLADVGWSPQLTRSKGKHVHIYTYIYTKLTNSVNLCALICGMGK